MTICSTVFVAMGRAQASKLGFAKLPIAAIQHPFGLRTRAEVSVMAETCARDIATMVGQETAA